MIIRFLFNLSKMAAVILAATTGAAAMIEGPAGGIQAESVAGAAVSIDLVLTNPGTEASPAITVEIPSHIGWLAAGLPNPIPSISGGQSVTIPLVGTVPVATPLGPIDGNLVVTQADDGNPLLVPIRITVTPTPGTAVLEVLVEDELTYFNPGSPRVAGATVALIDPLSGQTVGSAVTPDTSGRVELTGLAGGSYLLRVGASHHEAAQQTVTLATGSSQSQTLFLKREEVSYTFQVTSEAVAETNQLTLGSQFATIICRPRMTISPSSIAIGDVVNGLASADLTVTHHGHLRFENIMLQHDAPPGVSITDSIGPGGLTLQAGNSLVIPIQLQVTNPSQLGSNGVIQFGLTATSGGAGNPASYTLPFGNSPPAPTVPPVAASADFTQSVAAEKSGTTFQFTLPVANLHASAAMTGLVFSYQILDATNQNRTAGFDIVSVLPSSIAAGGSATFSLLMNPGADLGGSQSQTFRLIGTLDYNLAGVAKSLPIHPTPFRLDPLPRLALKVFRPIGAVVADDPLTEAIEAAVPFPVALMISNTGDGVARSVKLTAAQPLVSSNPAGLSFDPEQIGTAIGMLPAAPSLVSPFGDMVPGQTRLTRHLMTSTLSGSLSPAGSLASVANSSGGPVPAGDLAFQTTSDHDAIREVRDPRVGGVAGPAFLTDEIPDAVILPDTVHLADGSVASVSRPTATPGSPPTFEDRHALIQLSGATSGFVHVPLPDPSGGTMPLIGISRANGTPVDMVHNVWTTRILTSAPGDEPVFSEVLQLFDHDPGASLLLTYGNLPPQVTDIGDQTGSEHTLFTLTPEVSDPDSAPPDWSLGSGAPAGMTIDPATGAIAWTPGEQAGGLSYPITLTATDAHSPFATSSVTFDLTIAEQNMAPFVTPAQLDVVGGLRLIYQVVATDVDLPAQPLTYSFPGSKPTGMTISSAGVVVWNISPSAKKDTIFVNVRASDGTLTGTAQLQINIHPLSEFRPPTRVYPTAGGLYFFEAEELPYHRSELWSSPDLATWQLLQMVPPNANGTFSVEVPGSTAKAPKRFFQLRFPPN